MGGVGYGDRELCAESRQEPERLCRLSDEQIDYFGERFLFYQVGRIGITFEEFLVYPEVYIQAAAALTLTRLNDAGYISRGGACSIFAGREVADA